MQLFLTVSRLRNEGNALTYKHKVGGNHDCTNFHKHNSRSISLLYDSGEKEKCHEGEIVLACFIAIDYIFIHYDHYSYTIGEYRNR